MSEHRRLHLLVVSAVFAGAIAVVTAYILHIPLPTGGYIHLGDALIYLAACLLPTPYAVGAAMIGAGLADLLTAPMWVLPTLLVKAVVVLPFTSGAKQFLCRRNIVAVVISGLISPTGYALANIALAGTVHAFLPQFVGTLLQAVGSAVVFLVLAAALDRAGLKKQVLK